MSRIICKIVGLVETSQLLKKGKSIGFKHTTIGASWEPSPSAGIQALEFFWGGCDVAVTCVASWLF